MAYNNYIPKRRIEKKSASPIKLTIIQIVPIILRQIIEFQNKPILRPLSDLTKERGIVVEDTKDGHVWRRA